MQPNVCTDEVQDQLSAFTHMRAHCPVRRLTAPVWLSTTMCLHISWRLHTKVCSLNANTNVRNAFSENIYTPGVFDLEMKGGCFCMYGVSRIERIRKLGVMSCQVGVGYGWGKPTPRLNTLLHLLLLYWLQGCV